MVITYAFIPLKIFIMRNNTRLKAFHASSDEGGPIAIYLEEGGFTGWSTYGWRPITGLDRRTSYGYEDSNLGKCRDPSPISTAGWNLAYLDGTIVWCYGMH